MPLINNTLHYILFVEAEALGMGIEKALFSYFHSNHCWLRCAAEFCTCFKNEYTKRRDVGFLSDYCTKNIFIKMPRYTEGYILIQ